MKNRIFTILMVLGLVLPGLSATEAAAIEILTEEDFAQEVIQEVDLIKTADNAIILFDASSSMAKPYKDTGMSRYETALKTLKERNDTLPELGWNIGLYLYTPWTEIFPMQSYDRMKFAQSMEKMPAKPEYPTLLMQGLHESGKILKNLSGRTVIFIYTDGKFSRFRGMKHPAEKVKELAEQYDVCFYFISTADDAANEAILKKAADMHACARVIPFEAFIENPHFNSGALYVVKATQEVITMTEKKIVGVKIDNILFDFNKYDIRMDFKPELDELGQFMKQNPGSFAVMAGFTDNIGSEDYNLWLSAERTASAAKYVVNNHGIDPGRFVLHWFGKTNPVASNGTEAGRSKNRRVEIAIGLQ